MFSKGSVDHTIVPSVKYRKETLTTCETKIDKSDEEKRGSEIIKGFRDKESDSSCEHTSQRSSIHSYEETSFKEGQVVELKPEMFYAT